MKKNKTYKAEIYIAGDYHDSLPASITMTKITVRIHRAKAAQTLFGKFLGSSAAVWFLKMFERIYTFLK